MTSIDLNITNKHSLDTSTYFLETSSYSLGTSTYFLDTIILDWNCLGGKGVIVEGSFRCFFCKSQVCLHVSSLRRGLSLATLS